MRIDIWSDIVCPFCALGKRHLQLALADFPHRDDIELVWHSYELDPGSDAVVEGGIVGMLGRLHGLSPQQAAAAQQPVVEQAAAVGLTFDWQHAQPGNTFDAHRLVHLAATHGLADAAVDALVDGYFSHGVAVGDRTELARIGEQIGLPADEVRALLDGDAYADAVRADERQASELGIRGVPFFVLDQQYALSGAQPVEVFRQALQQAWDSREVTAPEAPTCTI